MLDEIIEFNSKQITEILEKNDSRENIAKFIKSFDTKKLESKLVKYINLDKLKEKHYAVLGIDIFEYSQRELFHQVLIPYTFHAILTGTCDWCINKKRNELLFLEYKTENDFNNNFISTGDGGFLIFDNPLLALGFALYFAFFLHLFNSYLLYPKYRTLTKELSVRYCLTYDEVYKLNNEGITNFYGSAIINNARIMSKDSLNRCLLDENTYEWFLKNTNGIESLKLFEINDFFRIPYFKTIYKKTSDDRKVKNISFLTKNYLKAIDLLKIGKIKSKKEILSVYNLHMQMHTDLFNPPKIGKRALNITLGNMNTSGIKNDV